MLSPTELPPPPPPPGQGIRTFSLTFKEKKDAWMQTKENHWGPTCSTFVFSLLSVLHPPLHPAGRQCPPSMLRSRSRHVGGRNHRHLLTVRPEPWLSRSMCSSGGNRELQDSSGLILQSPHPVLSPTPALQEGDPPSGGWESRGVGRVWITSEPPAPGTAWRKQRTFVRTLELRVLNSIF